MIKNVNVYFSTLQVTIRGEHSVRVSTSETATKRALEVCRLGEAKQPAMGSLVVRVETHNQAVQ